MNQKGQSFDVFQLLIAAVVAIAIMGILFGILGQVGITGTGSIGNDVRTLIKDAVNNGYGSAKTNLKASVAYGDSITPVNVTRDTDVTPDQICISTGDFEGDGLFTPIAGGSIKYNGTGSKKIGVSVLCGRSNELFDNLSLISDEATGYNFANCGDWQTRCEDAGSGTCCLVALRRV